MNKIKALIVTMRPEQWTKNVFVFAGLFFGKRFTDIATVCSTVQIFLIFCLVSSASYILNDILDKREDVHHPDKRNRPIAKGFLDIPTATGAAVALYGVGCIWSYSLSLRLLSIVLVFITLHILYDLWLKHATIIDVFAIALAFILRLIGGVALSDIEIGVSSWLLLCTFLLALFLALCKRRAEIALLSDRSHYHRKSLAGYSLPFLDQLITIVAGCAVVSYALYALSAETIAKHGTDKLKYTVPFVVYGIFRYLYLVHIKKGGSNPERILIRDLPFLANIVCYGTVLLLLVYGR